MKLTLEEALKQTERHGTYLIKISDRWREGADLSSRLRNTAELLIALAERMESKPPIGPKPQTVEVGGGRDIHPFWE